jgi:hypothetical protein
LIKYEAKKAHTISTHSTTTHFYKKEEEKRKKKKLRYEKLTVMKTRALITRGREVLGLTKSLKSLLKRKGRSRIL